MTQRTYHCERPLAMLLTMMLLISAAYAAPAHPAHADGFQRTVFATSFDDLAVGALSPGTSVPVAAGSVLAKTAPVEIVSVAGDGRALAVGGGGSAGAGVALLRFESYPGGLPQALNSRRYELTIKARFRASATTSPGALFGVELAGGSIFEIFSFGAGGKLTRGGSDLGLAYKVDETIELEARLDLKAGLASIKLESDDSSIERVVGLPGSFSADVINQLRFDAVTLDESVRYTIDKVEVKVEQDDEEDSEPPAIIVIDPPDTKVEFENGVAFVVLTINVGNKGGWARGVFLVINLRDDDLDDNCKVVAGRGAGTRQALDDDDDDDEGPLDLADLSFLKGMGYVKAICGGKIIIGIGENNRIKKSNVQLQLKLKVKGEGKSELKLKFNYRLRFSDSRGIRYSAPTVVNVVVPPVVVAPPVAPPPPTGVVSPTGTVTPTNVVSPTGGVFIRLPVERIDVRFRARWQGSGGLRIYGLPLSEPVTLRSGIIVQYFERARFEYHPNLAGTEFAILLGRLGVDLGYLQPPAPPPTSTNTISATWYFVPTGHYIAQPFRVFWRARGGLPIFGYPIGEAFINGDGRLVQYFERARLELHPELRGTEYEVQIGFLGEEALRARGGRIDD